MLRASDIRWGRIALVAAILGLSAVVAVVALNPVIGLLAAVGAGVAARLILGPWGGR